MKSILILDAFISDKVDEGILSKFIDSSKTISNDIKKLCYVSSIANIGIPTKEISITEETEWNPEKLHGDYAISKFGAETEVWRAHQEGVKVVIVNPGVIFGYGFPNQGSGLIIGKVKKGLLFYTKGKTGIIAIEDVINCMSLLMNSNVNGERFTLVSENVNFNSLLTMVAKGLNVKPPSIYANKWLTSLGWRVDWLSSKIFFRKRKFTRATSVSSHSIDTYENTKFITELNYSFIKMDEYLINLAQEYKQL